MEKYIVEDFVEAFAANRLKKENPKDSKKSKVNPKDVDTADPNPKK